MRLREGAFWRLCRAAVRQAQASVFLLSVAVLAFATGVLFGFGKWFPYIVVVTAAKTAVAIHHQIAPPRFGPYQFLGFSGGKISDVEKTGLWFKRRCRTLSTMSIF